MNFFAPVNIAQDNAQSAVALSPIMFGAGDEVQTKSRSNPYWMTVTSVNERTGFCRCRFGSAGGDAGNYHHTELKFHGGTQIEVALAS